MKTIEKKEVDKEAIKKEQDKIEMLIPYCQKIIDQFKTIGIDLKLEDVHSVVNLSLRSPSDQYLDDLLLKRALEMSKNAKHRSASKFEIRELIKMPDYFEVTKQIAKNVPEWVHELTNRHIDTAYLELKNGTVIKKPDTDQQISERFTKTELVPDYASINGESKFTQAVKSFIK